MKAHFGSWEKLSVTRQKLTGNVDGYRKTGGTQGFSRRYVYSGGNMLPNQACFSGGVTGNEKAGWRHRGGQQEGTEARVLRPPQV